jgi:excisionase family DNA binding protein
MSEATLSHTDLKALLRTNMGKRAKSVRQFAEDWGLGESTVWKLIRIKRLKAVKVGSRTLITDENEDEYARNLPRVGEAA